MFADDVRAGLSQAGQKQLPCQYFYDDTGTALFEAITVSAGIRTDARRLAIDPAAGARTRRLLPCAASGGGTGQRQRLEDARDSGIAGKRRTGDLLSDRSLGLCAGPLRAGDGRGRGSPSYRRIVFERTAAGGLRADVPASLCWCCFWAAPSAISSATKHRISCADVRACLHARRRFAAGRGPDQAAVPDAAGL